MNRSELLRGILKENEGVIIESPENRRWLTGMNTSNGMVLATADRLYFFTDFRYITAAKEAVNKDFEVLLFDGSHADTLKKYLPDSCKKILFEGDFLSVSAANKLFAALPDIEFEAADAAVNSLRAKKDEEEL